MGNFVFAETPRTLAISEVTPSLQRLLPQESYHTNGVTVMASSSGRCDVSSYKLVIKTVERTKVMKWDFVTANCDPYSNANIAIEVEDSDKKASPL